MKIYKRAILPSGFKANGLACGIKKSNKLDLALFYSEAFAKASCKFTTNKIIAAPIRINKGYLSDNGKFRAIIANSGNANCFTGKSGLKDAQDITGFLGRALNIKKETILVASTGIIGRRLEVHKIKKAIPDLVTGLSRQAIDKAKKAIMTTDTFSKEITVKFKIGGQTITLSAVAKGAGMIAPNMATMLVFIFTDCLITQRALDKALGLSLEASFNCITVDGCMSTNDSLILLANGAAKNDLIDLNRHFNLFVKPLKLVCLELAKMIVKDAEGATKFIQIKVNGAKNVREAKKAALSVANSNLFKTAMYGENPNFGRIVASIGASGIDVKEKDLKISLSALNKKEINVNVSLNRGIHSATVYTSDLTEEYIKINAEYN
jgi:glutamate N-acetyltransferase/amino-acid N-acetyltransferase